MVNETRGNGRMDGERRRWLSPPKAEATRSNRVGCTNFFKKVSGLVEERLIGYSLHDLYHIPNIL